MNYENLVLHAASVPVWTELKRIKTSSLFGDEVYRLQTRKHNLPEFLKGQFTRKWLSTLPHADGKSGEVSLSTKRFCSFTAFC